MFKTLSEVFSKIIEVLSTIIWALGLGIEYNHQVVFQGKKGYKFLAVILSIIVIPLNFLIIGAVLILKGRQGVKNLQGEVMENVIERLS